MSRKAKKGHSIPNPVAFNVIIDTDDDFTVDGQTRINRTVTVSKDGIVGRNLAYYLLNLDYKVNPNKSSKLTDFKACLKSIDFSNCILLLTLPKDHFDYTSKITFGGNQTITITLSN